MGSKEDWDEIKKWNENNTNKTIKKFGIDIYSEDRNKQTTKVNVISKFLGSIVNFIKIIVIIVIVLAAVVAFSFVNSSFSGLNESIDPNVDTTLAHYNRKIKIISEETDEKGNGKYICNIKGNNHVQFTLIKEDGHLKEDYLDRSLKYYFESWNDSYKSSFSVKEEFKDELLDYEIYIELESYYDIDDAAQKINKFAEYCGKWVEPAWNIYLKKEELQIYSNITSKNLANEMKQTYLFHVKFNHIQEDLPEEQF